MMPAAAAAEDWSACAFSLTCEEDGADLGDGVVDDGELFSPYNAGDEEEEEEYLEHLLFKETGFCSSSDFATDCDVDGEYHSVVSEEWFRQARLAAVKWILETRGYFGFGHRTAYLAIAYFDSFLLRRRVDREAMPWAAQLLSVACVSVAAKMEECQVPALSEFDAGGYDFCPASIRRMELLVLSTLGWRMGAVTPFDFLPCFSSRLHPHGGAGAGAGGRVALKAIGFIFATAEAGSVLDHRPSTVAAAAILAATYGPLLTKEALDSKMSHLSPSCLIEKEHVHACYSMMVGDMNRKGNKRSLPCSGSNEVATSTYDSVLVDHVTDTAAAFATAVAARNKRIRLELPGIR
ncbi:Cyclin-D5-2 [Dichanthelium oligosanthes]|uniref:Cyclin-D5-2 n=1 Tax=Dichanthelium oligosanthes TaxID=888268 RepID=A0A1E5WEL0_9POAL|nr:Cyclin-D5-2 [Dichanthelium oligosanthes]